jgi:hypothetical protein
MRLINQIREDPGRIALSASAVVAIGINLADMIGLLDHVSWIQDRLPAITAILVASSLVPLAAMLTAPARIHKDVIESGSAQLTSLACIENKIDSLIVSSALRSADEVYREAELLVSGADSRIRSTAFGNGGDRAHRHYDVIAELARRRESEGRHFRYRVVLPCATDSRGATAFDRSQFCRKRMIREAAFASRNVTKSLDIRCLKDDLAWGIDLLIIDRRSVLLAFIQEPENELCYGISIVNNPTVVGLIVDWYDDYLCGDLTEKVNYAA